MPTYEYACAACGHKFEEFQSITAKPITKCPVCKKKKVQRLISAGAGFIFKGSGFYQTDYRSEAYKTAAKADTATPVKADAVTSAKSDTKTESKLESKTETKTPAKTESKSGSKSEAKTTTKGAAA